MKKALVFILSLVMIITTLTPAVLAAEEPTLKVQTASDASAGDEVSIDITFENNPGVMGMVLNLQYDKTRLELIGSEDGIFEDWAVVTRAVWIGDDDDDSDGVILTLKFKVLDNAPLGAAAVTVSYDDGDIANSNEELISPAIIAGGVTVVEKPAYIVGDINNDGRVNNIDATLALRYSVGGFTEAQLAKLNIIAGDVNKNGNVNNIDATIILRYSVGSITALPI